jgi:acetolactate synthase small subunit
MATKAQFTGTVHSAVVAPIQTQAEVAGRVADVSVDSLIVEIVSDDGLMTHTLRLPHFTPEQLEALVAGASVTATFTVN